MCVYGVWNRVGEEVQLVEHRDELDPGTQMLLLSLPFCVCWLGSQTNPLHGAAGKVCFHFSQHHFLQDELNLISDLRVHNPSEGL